MGHDSVLRHRIDGGRVDMLAGLAGEMILEPVTEFEQMKIDPGIVVA